MLTQNVVASFFEEFPLIRWPSWVETAVVDLAGVRSSASARSGSGVETFGDVCFMGSS